MLTQVGMQDCNPVDTPFPPGVLISKLDEPTTTGEERTIIDKVNSMFNTMFNKYEEVQNLYRSIVSSIGWAVKMVGPSVALAHSMLGKAMAAPSVKAFKAAKHTLRFFKGHLDMSINYFKTREWDWRNGDYPVFEGASDASFADDVADRKTQGGSICGWTKQAPTVWSSSKSDRICLSTYHAESVFASKCCREMEYNANVHIFLGIRNNTSPPMVLKCDNQATTFAAGAPIRKFSQRSKQFDIEEKYVQQCVEEGLISVIHVPGSINSTDSSNNGYVMKGFCVDAMTKPLTGSLIKNYYGQLHGSVKG